jgi:hypothetical protein
MSPKLLTSVYSPVKLICFLLVLTLSTSAIVVSGYSDAENLRFHDDPAFIGSPYSWSGVGRVSATLDTSSNSHHREWATLLGENYFISAVHYKPNPGDTITFSSGNSPTSPTFHYTVAGGFGVPDTDLWIGYTAGAMDSSLKRYAFDTTPADSLSDTGLIASTLYMTGDDVAGGAGTLSDTIIATNQAETWIEGGSTTFQSTPGETINLSSAIPWDTFVNWENLTSDTANTATTHEGFLESGDSGSPAFQIVGGELEIVGLAYAVINSPGVQGNFDAALPGNEERRGSLYSYVGSYETAINNTIALVPTPVPEPSSLLLFLLGSLTLLRRRNQ